MKMKVPYGSILIINWEKQQNNLKRTSNKTLKQLKKMDRQTAALIISYIEKSCLIEQIQEDLGKVFKGISKTNGDTE